MNAPQNMISVENLKEILVQYSTWLEKTGYLDSDWWCEYPKAVDRYIQEKYPPFSPK